MSLRRRPPEEPEDPPDEPEEPPDDEDVEYFVLVLLEVCCSTSVPKSAQSSQTSNSAPRLDLHGLRVRNVSTTHLALNHTATCPGARLNGTPGPSPDSGELPPRGDEPLDRREVADDGEETEQPGHQRESAYGRHEHGETPDEADERESVRAPEQAAVHPVEADSLGLCPEVGREQDASHGGEAEVVAPDAGGEPRDHDDVGVPVEHVVEQVAGQRVGAELPRERAVEQVEPAVEEDEERPTAYASGVAT